ncbi:MAG TPA: carboxypeptidase-like regulatory domain-containing protein, partial [Solirubrobacterales bacterium]|nr:carboxypeptidase-like regulatory domain-containing protein [Solirubrobacterales bacterium]
GRATRLAAHLVAGARRTRAGRAHAGPALTVDYGSAVTVRGRLTDAHGEGIAGRPVSVVARAAAGGGDAPGRRRVVTDRAGRFSLRLPPGTSRRVLVAFHGGGGFAPAHRRSLALRVRAGVSLTAAPPRLRTGESVTLSGRVRPGPARIPARGKLVTIQYLERASGRWRPALVVRTGARGRFHARYRFRYVTGEARIRLRATALPEAGWPYAAGSSAPVTVTVHGR